MNPGLIPPRMSRLPQKGPRAAQEVSPWRNLGRRSSRKATRGAPRRLAARRHRDERLFCAARGRQGFEKPRVGRRNQPVRRLYRLVALGRRTRPPVGRRSARAPEQNRGGINSPSVLVGAINVQGTNAATLHRRVSLPGSRRFARHVALKIVLSAGRLNEQLCYYDTDFSDLLHRWKRSDNAVPERL